MPEFNPYAAPVTDVSRPALEGDVWRDGNVLVMTKQGWLPDRCVKCNDPTTYRLKRSLMWHSPIWYALIIILGPILYILVAMIVRQTAKIQLPLCDRHRSKRLKMIGIAWLLVLGGIGLAIVGGNLNASQEINGAVMLAGGLTFVAGVIVGVIVSQIIVVQKIDKYLVRLKNVNPSFLDELPAWNR
jgi:hypothetical protein